MRDLAIFGPRAPRVKQTRPQKLRNVARPRLPQTAEKMDFAERRGGRIDDVKLRGVDDFDSGCGRSFDRRRGGQRLAFRRPRRDRWRTHSGEGFRFQPPCHHRRARWRSTEGGCSRQRRRGGEWKPIACSSDVRAHRHGARQSDLCSSQTGAAKPRGCENRQRELTLQSLL